MSPRSFIPFVLFLCAQTTAPADVAGELERLRAENARLRAELSALKAQQAATTQRAVGASGEATATTRPVVRRFTSMPDLLATTPAELRPKPNEEWYKYTKFKFEQWWHDQLIGIKFEQTLGFRCEVGRSQVARKGEEFVMRGQLYGKEFIAFTANHTWGIVSFERYMNEATAKKWDAIKPGTLFKVTGTVKQARLHTYSSHGWPQYQVTLELADFEMAPAN